MATCLKLTTKTLQSQKPRVLSSFYTERWFGMLLNQGHLVHTTSYFIGGGHALITDRLRASFSTCLQLTDEPVLDLKMIDASSNTSDKKLKPQQNQYQLPPNTCEDLFKAWGCNSQQISKILKRMPALHNARLDKLQSKLQILQNLGFTPPGLVQMVSCRPRFLRCRINRCLDERVRYLEQLFGSKETLQKVILRNPSVLTYDLENMIMPTVELYRSMGITGRDLTLMLLSRPTMIPRTSLNAEKLEYIRKTGTSKDSKMYKYVVTLMAISRLETIREKVANLEKFGFLEDEVLRLLGMSPLVLTLSVDKVQRNMTFVVATMKQPARVVLKYPFLLYRNLEAVLKPRITLSAKIDDMGIGPSVNGPKVFTALRMTEKRFLKVFVDCHPPEIANELMRCYVDAKDVKRLAEKAKKIQHKGFPF